ncbi:acyltransferase [Flavobacterium sp.]|uniref:acyltransferase n=1 Tax=Flavobacterium sp. TaxID=239 RepID=UPI003752936C
MRILYKINNFCFVTLRIWKYIFLSDCKNSGGKPNRFHPLLLSGTGKIMFGKNVQIGVISSPNYFSHYSYIEARGENSSVCIGNNVAINNAFSAIAMSKITIDDNVLIGINCSIIDNDGHDLNPSRRDDINIKFANVHIEKNVFIGDNVTILKGVTIGENSVVGSGSIVTKSVVKNVVVAGNPAKIIRTLEY